MPPLCNYHYGHSTKPAKTIMTMKLILTTCEICGAQIHVSSCSSHLLSASPALGCELCLKTFSDRYLIMGLNEQHTHRQSSTELSLLLL